MATRRVTKTVRVDRGRGVYMISVAAELADMHPQTLRIYESRGLITPQRSPKGTRLYSEEDVDRLRRIQELTTELGMNLAGVERVFELEQELERMQRRMDRLEREAEATRRKLEQEVEKVRKSFRAELVPYTGPRGQDLVPARAHAAGVRRFRVPIERAPKKRTGSSDGASAS
jgi:MerR family transcriptional regulator, heat shock protein HspR